MSGHSKWAGIKHKKAIIDAKKGKMFSKFIKEITVAAKGGGGDPDKNPRLRTAIDSAKAINMPGDNIKKAIQRGTGELPGVSYEEMSYEGYGPGGVAVMVDTLTDNKNRITSEVRNVFSRRGGNLGETGCVGWMFNKKGYITVEKSRINEDRLMEIVLEAGAEDIEAEDEEIYEIVTPPENYEKVKKALADNKVEISSSEITNIPSTYIKLEGKQAEQMLALMNSLEDLEDVQNVYANFDIPREIMEKVKS